VTTRRDPEGRPTVYALLPPDVPFVGPVGRLDLDSSGLLLLTNDTQLAAFLTAPDSHVEKVYEVELDAPVDAIQAARLEAGIVVLGRRTLPARVELGSPAPSRALRITLVEGRNRQVRRMVASLGREVVRLHRVRIGPLVIEGLGEGRARRLRPVEVEALAALRLGRRPRRATGGPSNDRGASWRTERGRKRPRLRRSSAGRVGQRPSPRKSSAGRGSAGASPRARSQASRAPAVSPSAARHKP
jgi:pseudouridine synthase